MKGIILAGGTGSRLWPITKGVSKQLLPLYDKPMIFYSLATLMSSGIREICIVTTTEDQHSFIRLLGSGDLLGIRIEYRVQEKPEGLAQAFLICETFIAGSSVALILGDNLFHGVGLGHEFQKYNELKGAQIFAYHVKTPEQYGVVEFDQTGKVISLEEKPTTPKSQFAVPGLYFYDNEVVDIAKEITPSPRGELEITSVNEVYLKNGKLNVAILPRGTAWLDTGTFESMFDASSYIRALEIRQGQKIGCIEEIAYRNEWISIDQLMESAQTYQGSELGIYLRKLASEI
jgi:glucose-1-phosphate thymidylyltransferase